MYSRLVDLTHIISPSIPTWSGCCGFEAITTLDYGVCTSTTKFRVQKFCMDAGIGTHIDAPAHCIPGGRSVADLKLEELYVPACVINLQTKADAYYKVLPEDIFSYEQCYGVIPKGSLVIIATGWERFWQEPKKYLNDYVYPTVSLQAAQILLERGVVGLAIDTLSPDGPEEFSVHQLFLGHDTYLVENVAQVTHLPPQGAYVLTVPLKIEGGTESPVRMVGFIP